MKLHFYPKQGKQVFVLITSACAQAPMAKSMHGLNIWMALPALCTTQAPAFKKSYSGVNAVSCLLPG